MLCTERPMIRPPTMRALLLLAGLGVTPPVARAADLTIGDYDDAIAADPDNPELYIRRARLRDQLYFKDDRPMHKKALVDIEHAIALVGEKAAPADWLSFRGHCLVAIH